MAWLPDLSRIIKSYTLKKTRVDIHVLIALDIQNNI